MRTQLLMQLHRKAADCIALIEQAKQRQETRSEYAAQTYLNPMERPFWADFPEFVDKAREEAAAAPKVVARLQKSYIRIMNQINSVVYEEGIA